MNGHKNGAHLIFGAKARFKVWELGPNIFGCPNLRTPLPPWLHAHYMYEPLNNKETLFFPEQPMQNRIYLKIPAP